MIVDEPIRIRQLQALNILAESGTMSLTAKAMNISQPAVSRLLADLSKELGYPLFSRSGRRLTLTREAQYLLPEIQRIFGAMGQIRNLRQNIQAGTSGHLKIACLPGFSTSHLPGVVADFLSARPETTVTIEPDRPERILDWVIGEQYDCGITDGFRSHHALDSKTIPIRCVCVFPEGHRLASKSIIHPEDLAGERIAHDRFGSEFYLRLRDILDAAGIAMDNFIETRQFTCACELAAKGVCVSVVSELDAKQYAGRGVGFRPFSANITHQLSLVWPNHKSTSILTLEFLGLFEKSLQPFALLEG
ncbi:LysR family transcriptional regulator [Tritonibacter mobilis]|uniref:LysR family transcriptional regulator n=1 Tax=Tritonibacter mobilis TaxID=379347 RepID=UPI000806C125|nr:LysR family transcriptional regulator [Tritonibacter mobilis]